MLCANKSVDMFNLFKTSNSKIPKRIPIARMEDYHTHYLGKTNDGKLFFGYETYANKKPHWEVKPELQSKNRIDIAVLYLFDKKGRFITSKHWLTDLDEERQNTTEKLEEMIAEFGQITFCDIEIEIFKTTIDGIQCGLIPDEEYESVGLYPSSTISFQEPWDGEYET